MTTDKTELPLLFLHIPKTAGASLNRFISSNFKPHQMHPYNRFGHRGNMLFTKLNLASPFQYYGGHYLYSYFRNRMQRRFSTITVLRDPIERFISLFSYLQEHPTIYQDFPWLSLDALSIDEYAQHPWLVDATDNVDGQAFCLIGNIDWDKVPPPGGLSQRLWPADPNSHVERACKMLDRLEVVGLCERLDETLELLCYTFGWLPPVRIPRINITKQRPSRSQLSPVTLSRIQGYNALDIKLYAYATRLFERRYRAMIANLWEFYHDGAEPDGRDVDPSGVPADLRRAWLTRHAMASHREAGPLATSVHVDFAQCPLDENWYAPDLVPEFGQVCWTGPGTSSYLSVIISDERDARIRVRVVHAVKPEILGSFTLAANGAPIDVQRRSDDAGTSIFEGLISRSVIEQMHGLVRLELRVAKTVVPAACVPGSQDRRSLGLAVNWVKLDSVGV